MARAGARDEFVRVRSGAVGDRPGAVGGRPGETETEREFVLTDGTGQRVVARKGDLMYIPMGTRMVHT